MLKSGIKPPLQWLHAGDIALNNPGPLKLDLMALNDYFIPLGPGKFVRVPRVNHLSTIKQEDLPCFTCGLHRSQTHSGEGSLSARAKYMFTCQD